VGGVHLEPCADYDTPGKNDYYVKPLRSGKDVVMDPVEYTVGGRKTMRVSLCAPIRQNGNTVGVAGLADTGVLLEPNHTGRGGGRAVWPDGRWDVPGGGLSVDEELARALLAADTRLAEDYEAHLGEHSLEVIVPFLRGINPATRIVPIVVAEYNPTVLADVAVSMAGVVKSWPGPVSIVVSSDMSHYVSHDTAKSLDALATAEIAALRPMGLFSVVRDRGITMCGVLPMTLALFLARELGARTAEVAAYATSGEVSGDMRHVVGYAGVLVS